MAAIGTKIGKAVSGLSNVAMTIPMVLKETAARAIRFENQSGDLTFNGVFALTKRILKTIR